MKIITSVALFFFCVSAYSTTYYVQDTMVVGIEKDEGKTTTELIKSAVGESGKNQSVGSPAQSKYVLRPKLMKLGSAYVLTIEKLEGQNVRFSSQMKAEHFEEMDNVVMRVVRSVVDEVPLQNDVRVKDVTENEAVTGTRRRETVNRWYFGFGPAGASNVDSSGTLFNWALGYFWEVNPTAAVKLFYDGTSDRFNYLGLGGNYYFSERDSSPLAMMELGYGTGYRRNEDDSASETTTGFVLGAGVGYQFFRTSKVNLEILANYAYLLAANHLGNPSKYGLRLGIYW